MVTLRAQLDAPQEAQRGLAGMGLVQAQLVEVLHRDPSKYGPVGESTDKTRCNSHIHVVYHRSLNMNVMTVYKVRHC